MGLLQGGSKPYWEAAAEEEGKLNQELQPHMEDSW